MDGQGDLSTTRAGQTSYVVAEGKKRAASRSVREEADWTRYFKVTGVRPEIGILTDNWHSNQVLENTQKNFLGRTISMRTLEAWGAQVESEDRAYYVAGGRVWILDLEPGLPDEAGAAGAQPQPRSGG